MKGLPVTGYDRFVDGAGEMRWKLLGIIPIISALGTDITRSAAGRFAAESVWLPSLLLSSNASWTAGDSSASRVTLNVDGYPNEMELLSIKRRVTKNEHATLGQSGGQRGSFGQFRSDCQGESTSGAIRFLRSYVSVGVSTPTDSKLRESFSDATLVVLCLVNSHGAAVRGVMS